MKTSHVQVLPGSGENDTGDVGILKERRDDREEVERKGRESRGNDRKGK